MLALANPLFPAAELLEKEFVGRGLLSPADLLLWDITALENEVGWSGYGYVFRLRKVEQPESDKGLWRNAGFGIGVSPVPKDAPYAIPGLALYEALGHTHVYFNRTGYMSNDAENWAYPAGSPIIGQFTDLLIVKDQSKIPA